MIKDMKFQLIEVGKIKIGGLGAEREKSGGGVFRLPHTIDYFNIVSTKRGPDGNFIPDPIMKKLGDKPTKLNIMLMNDDIETVSPTRYELYIGKKLSCYGDGATASRILKTNELKTIECNSKTCEYRQKGSKLVCKPSLRFTCLLPDSDSLGGCYRFRTHGKNSVEGVISSLLLVKQLTGGMLAWLPLIMKLNPVIVPIIDEKTKKPIQKTIQVVNIEYEGNATMLLEKAMSVRKEQIDRHINMKQLEEQSKQFLIGFDDSGDPDIGPEYYPENQDVEETTSKPDKVITLEDKLDDNASEDTQVDGSEINAILDRLGRHGYSEMDVQGELGHSIDEATQDELAELRAIAAKLDSGIPVEGWKA